MPKRYAELDGEDIFQVKSIVLESDANATIISREIIEGGRSEATRGVERIVFLSGSRRISVVVKQLLPKSREGLVPREWDIHNILHEAGVSNLISMPQYFGRFRSVNGDYCLIFEDIRKKGTSSDVLAAISALAKLSSIRPEEYSSLFQRVRKLQQRYRRSSARLGFERNSQIDILDRFVTCMDNQDVLRERFHFPIMALSHGDGHVHNFLKRPSGELCMIDMGGLRVSPLGYDIAKVLVFWTKPSFLHKHHGMENVVIEAFFEILQKTYKEISCEELRFGYAIGLWNAVKRNGIQMKRVYSVDLIRRTDLLLKILLRVQGELISSSQISAR